MTELDVAAAMAPVDGEHETWKATPGVDGYEVSTLGRVRSYFMRNGRALRKEPRLLKPALRNGYLRVRVGKRLRDVHTLVLEAFVGPRPPGYVARHFPDRTRTNCRLSNLQWGSYQENSDDMIVHGTKANGSRNGATLYPERRPRGSRHGLSVINESIALQVFTHRGWLSRSHLAHLFDVSRSVVDRIQDGKTWQHAVSGAYRAPGTTVVTMSDPDLELSVFCALLAALPPGADPDERPCEHCLTWTRVELLVEADVRMWPYEELCKTCDEDLRSDLENEVGQ